MKDIRFKMVKDLDGHSQYVVVYEYGDLVNALAVIPIHAVDLIVYERTRVKKLKERIIQFVKEAC